MGAEVDPEALLAPRFALHHRHRHLLSLGVGGQVAAASAVVAAKGIIRFPELNAQKRGADNATGIGIGIDEVTEYFLVGSFASWLLALGGMALVLTT